MHTYFYDPEKKCFLHAAIHTIEPHYVGLSDEEYQGLLLQLNSAGILQSDTNGRPKIVQIEHAEDDVHSACALLYAEVNALYQDRMATIADGYPMHERESWSVQLEEAKALQANPDAETPWLDACAASRGLDKTELARRVLEKDAAYRVISGNLSGIRQRHEDAIALLETVEQAQAYDVNAWWPE